MQPDDPTADAVQFLRSPEADPLWEPLRADGYEVAVQQDGDAVAIRIDEGEAPCPDCLLPPDVLAEIARTFVSEHRPAAADVRIGVTLPGA